jgi:hypothetical protein
LARSARATYGQAGIVRAQRFRSNENGVHVPAKLTCVAPSRRSRDPARLLGRPRQSTIKRHPTFCDDEWLPGDDPLVESLVEPGAIIGQNALPHLHTRISQLHDTFAAVPRVHVNCADNHVSNASLDYRICACSSAPSRGTRLQSNVERSARGHGRAEIAQTLNLGVIATRFPMMSLRHNSIINHENRSNSRVRTRLTNRFSCLV